MRSQAEGAVSRAAWKAIFDETRASLINDHGVHAREASLRARAVTERRLGAQPPGLLSAVIKAGLGLLTTGGEMKWDWTKTAWKSIRGFLAASALVGFLYFGGLLDTAGELEAIGVPKLIAPLIAIGVVSAISGVRNWVAINRPHWNIVKLAGQKLKALTSS